MLAQEKRAAASDPRRSPDRPGGGRFVADEGDAASPVVTIWETDARGQNFYQSPSWYSYVGEGPGGSYGEGWLRFYHPQDRELLVREWTQALESGGAYRYDIRVRIRRHDGAYEWFRVTGAPLRDTDGVVTSWVGTCTQIRPSRTAALPSGAQALEPRRPKRVVVADDNVDAALSVQLALQSMGHEVWIAHDGPAAVELVRTVRPHLLLLDIAMPGLDGYEVARRVRRDLGPEALTIIALSGFAVHDERARLDEAGIDQALLKPLDPAFLASLLDRPKRS